MNEFVLKTGTISKRNVTQTSFFQGDYVTLQGNDHMGPAKTGSSEHHRLKKCLHKRGCVSSLEGIYTWNPKHPVFPWIFGETTISQVKDMLVPRVVFVSTKATLCRWEAKGGGGWDLKRRDPNNTKIDRWTMHFCETKIRKVHLGEVCFCVFFLGWYFPKSCFVFGNLSHEIAREFQESGVNDFSLFT